MKVYVAGPMTGIPKFNFPAFDDAARCLRGWGHDVVSPAELDDPETRKMALASPDGSMGSGVHNGETWGDFLARDVKIIADSGVEAIVVLPGWNASKGARLETFVGRLSGLPVFQYDFLAGIGEPVPVHELEEAHGRLRETAEVNETYACDRMVSTVNGKEVDFYPALNPKDAAATRDKKPPLHLLEYAADVEIAKALADGARKYGRKNFHTIPILANVYGGAIRRHVGLWLSGEDYASDSGIHHLAHVGANIHVLFAAMANGMLQDDRGPEERSEVQERLSAASNQSAA